MVNPYLVKFTFLLVLIKTINIKCQMKSMTNTVLDSYAYNNILVMKYFCMATNFSHAYMHMHVQ